MSKKRQTRAAPDAASPMSKRIAKLASLLWNNNMSAMGRALNDLSYMTISRVITGAQPPPGPLLEALARRPEINVAWLMKGEGEPLLPQPGLGQGGCYCPISEEFLMRPPAESPGKLTGATFPVPAPFFSASAYVLRVAADNFLVKAAPELVRPGDYILVETGPELTQTATRLEGQVIVIRPDDQKPVILARVATRPVDYFEHPELYELELLSQKGKAILDAEPIEPGKGRPRVSRRAAKEATQEGAGLRFRIQQVIGICKLSLHPW